MSIDLVLVQCASNEPYVCLVFSSIELVEQLGEGKRTINTENRMNIIWVKSMKNEEKY